MTTGVAGEGFWVRIAPLLLLAAVIGLALLLQNLLPIAIYTVYVVLLALWQERRYWREYLAMYQSIRPRHVAIAAPTALMVITVAIGTWQSGNAALKWSWFESAGDEATNSIALPFQWGFFAWIWGLLLIAALPVLALVEERVFRRGIRSTRDLVTRSFMFGLIHCIVGVPLGAGLLALPLGGLVFGLEYLRALKANGGLNIHPKAWEDDDDAYAIEERAVFASGVLHLAYNLSIVAIGAGLWLFGDFLPEPILRWLGSD